MRLPSGLRVLKLSSQLRPSVFRANYFSHRSLIGKMIAMNDDLVEFVRSRLDADEHNVVMIRSLAPPGTDVTLDSTIPMIDAIRAATDLYATVAHLEPPARGASRDFEAGWAAGLGAAVRLLAQAYHDSPDYREEWRPQALPE
ncbi:hypothetical protein SSPIM334S_08161 [Streptomyces spiroverticillatus]